MSVAYLLMACATLAAPAEETAATNLTRGLAAYSEFDYRAARPWFEAVLAEPESSAADRGAALAHLARTLAVLRFSREAERRFFELLEVEPEHRVSWEESPRIRAAFAAARRHQARLAKRALSLASEAPAPLDPVRTSIATAAVIRPSPAAPPLELTSAPEPTSQAQWLFLGGVTAAAGAVLVVLLLVGGGENAVHDDRVIYRWHLP